MSFSADLAAIVSPNDSMLDKRTRTFLTGSVLLLTLRRTCVHANPEPSSANRTGYYVESTNVHPLPIAKLGPFTAHIYCLHIIDLRARSTQVSEKITN